VTCLTVFTVFASSRGWTVVAEECGRPRAPDGTRYRRARVGRARRSLTATPRCDHPATSTSMALT